TREAGDEGRADDDFRADRTPLGDAFQRVLGRGRALHGLQNLRAGVLEGHIQVGQDLAFGHQRNDVIDRGVRVDVMQADPDAELGQRLAQLLEARLDRLAAPETGAVLDIDAVGAGVLRNDQDLFYAGPSQVLGLGQHVADRPRNQRATQRGDDAEGAAVVAAFGNLQVGEVVRR